MIPTRSTVVRSAAGLALAFLVAGCAAALPGGPSDGAPPWPYPGVAFPDRLPPELQGQALYRGGWIVSNPAGDAAYTEAVNPRYLVRVPFGNPRYSSFIDLGVGALVENLAFTDDGRNLFLVAALTSPHQGRAVVARAILEVDLQNRILLNSFPLNRDEITRGFAVDSYTQRGFLLEDSGDGSGTVRIVDLYQGRSLGQAPVGLIPAAVDRKGIAVDGNVRHVFVLTGGESARGDFQPVSGDTLTKPALVVLDADSLVVQARVPTDPRFELRAVHHDDDRNRVYVLMSNHKQSRLLIVDDGYFDVRNRVDLPEPVTDLVVRGGYAFMPGAHGIYIVDLLAETWVSRPNLYFEFPGDMAVSADLSTALVLFQSASTGVAPGLASVDLHTGTLLEVLQ